MYEAFGRCIVNSNENPDRRRFMRHPFDIADSQAEQQDAAAPQDTDRRSVLGRGLAIAGGLAGLAAASEALGQQMTTMAIGEEGGKKKAPPKATTRALGEEGGRKPPIKTTKAIGEEGGRPIATTMAIGEEGGKRPPSRGRLSTARCEEGGRFAGKDKRITDALAHLRRGEALTDEGDYIQAYRQIEQAAPCSDSDIRSLHRTQLSRLDSTMRTAVAQADKDLQAGNAIVEAIAVHIALSTMPKLRYAPRATRTKLADLKKRGEYESALQEMEAGRLYRQAERLILESRTAANGTLKQIQVRAARDLLAPLGKTYPKAPSTARAGTLLKSL